MFNLVVEAAAHPCEHLGAGSEIGGGLQLMRQRIVLHLRSGFSFNELELFKHVSWLEDGCEDQPCDRVHDHISEQHLTNRQTAKQRWNDEDVGEVQKFRDDQLTEESAKSGPRGFNEVFAFVAIKRNPVFRGHPEQRHNAIEEPGIDELQFVNLLQRTVWRKA